jgi:hypothetical protein
MGCAETVGVRVLRPAEINLRGINKIAVGDISGPGGQELSSELTTALMGTGRYEVLDRQNLDKVMAEQQLSGSNIADPETAIKAGKVLGASAAIFGSVTRHDYQEVPVKRENFEVKDGNNKTQYMIRYTRSGSAKVNVSLRVTDLSTGKILASKTYSEEKPEQTQKEVPAGTNPRDAEPDPIDGTSSLAGARATIIERFTKAIAPYYETLNLPFETTGDLPELEQGVNQAKANAWPRAIQLFQAATAKSQSLPPKKQAYAHLDLGMALCFGIGDFDNGLNEIRTATALKNDSDWQRVAGMCEGRKSDAARLAAQGVTDGGSP